MRAWIALMRSMARMSPGRLARELVGAVRGADRDRQRIELRIAHEVGRLVGIGEQHLARHRAFGAVAVFLVALHRLERAEAAQLALDGDADRVRHADDLARHVEVVVVARDRLAVGHQRAVHHHAGEAELHRRRADVGRLAVILVHDDGNVRIALDCGFDQVPQEGFARIFARTGGRLHDHRAVGLGRGRHDRLHLLQIVDVEGGQAVLVIGGVVQQLAHRD